MVLSNSKLDILYKYDKPINWNISGFGNDINLFMILTYVNRLREFNIENPIKTIHGSYISKYNGGRLALFTRNNQYILNKIQEVNNLNIGIKLTFSNPYISKEMYEEKEMREYLELLNETKDIGNGIICSIDEFANFIHKNYPNLEVVSSYVKLANETKLGKTDTIEYYNNLFNIYDKVVINTYRAFDEDFLNKIIYKDRIEIIVNNSCNLNCQIADQHYEWMYKLSQRIKYLYDNHIEKSDPQVEIIRNNLRKINNNCKERRLNFNIEKNKYQQLNRDELNNLLNLGINNFKLEGRDLDLHFFRFVLFKYIFKNDSIFDGIPLIPKNEELQDFFKHKIIDN